jgi:5-methylcytosine-specific restriction endonuclease McrA
MRYRNNRHDPAYKEWRAAVMKRDKHKCQMPDCKARAKQVHHIVRYADSPYLRFVVSNGIALCWVCHRKIKNKEQFYARLFQQIVENKDV